MRKPTYLVRSIERLLANSMNGGSKVLVPDISGNMTLFTKSPESISHIDRLSVNPMSGSEVSSLELSLGNESHVSKPEYDFVVLHRILESVYEARTILQEARSVLPSHGRLIVVSYSRIFQPVRSLSQRLRRAKSPYSENWIPSFETKNLLEQSGFEVVTTTHHILVPFFLPLIGNLVNRWLAPLPVFRLFTLVSITSARPIDIASSHSTPPSVSVVIAARNEAGNIRELLDRIPIMSDRQEVILVEGGSTDDTWSVIESEISDRNFTGPGPTYISSVQPGRGKADAIRRGFEIATGEILIILDADISVPPEELQFFVDQLVKGTCDFANGSRLVYEMDARAMRFLNLIGNRLFGIVFTFLLGQQIRDTLCGTKALWRDDYLRIARGREFFGDFDPFGDFDLLFGAARLNLRIRDIPIHYKERTYGSTNISRFRHGLLLVRMSAIAARKIRFVGGA